MMLLIRILLLSLLFSFPALAEEETLEQDDTSAPSWSLQKADISYGSESLVGKPYVIHFWATWCPYCKKLQPGLDSMSKDYQDTGIATYAVSFWENAKAKPIKEMQRRGLDLEVLINGDEVAKAFNVQGTPTTLFVDHEGEIVARLTTSDPNDPQIRLAYELLKDNYSKKDEPKPTAEDSE